MAHLQRTCVGCRRTGDKSAFVRLVKSPVGTVSLDAGGREPGRGAYVCRSAACVKKALKGGRLARALRCGLTESVIDELGTVTGADND